MAEIDPMIPLSRRCSRVGERIIVRLSDSVKRVVKMLNMTSELCVVVRSMAVDMVERLAVAYVVHLSAMLLICTDGIPRMVGTSVVRDHCIVAMIRIRHVFPRVLVSIGNFMRIVARRPRRIHVRTACSNLMVQGAMFR